MLSGIINFSLRNRGLVLFAVLGVIVSGIWSLRQLDIDAFPDTTPIMVQINTTAPSLSPEEIEELKRVAVQAPSPENDEDSEDE